MSTEKYQGLVMGMSTDMSTDRGMFTRMDEQYNNIKK